MYAIFGSVILGWSETMPNIGLVLSGGFAKGAYQVGVLRAIGECLGDERIKYISASSVGVLNAYAFVHGKMDPVEQMWRNARFTGLRSFVNTYVRSHYISNAIKDVACGFSQEQKYFYAAYLDVTRLRLDYVNLGDTDPKRINDYLQASVSLPIFSKPVEIAGTKYADGAVVDNIPVKPLMGHPFDYAIVVHFDQHNYVFENSYFDGKLIKINFLDDKIFRDSLAFDNDSISSMIESGFEESMTIFDMIFKNGLDDVEYIYHKIKFLSELRGKKSFRLTGDIVVNNMNKALKKIVKSRI